MRNNNREDRGGFRGGGFRPRGRGFSGGDRQMFKAVCDNCGNECEVPFRPTSGKPVYCSNCFEKMGGRDRDTNSRFERPRRREVPDQNKDFDAMNAKLDKILRLLETKPVEEVKAPKKK